LLTFVTCMTISKDGRPIRSLADWKARAGPKRVGQWKEHRSAFESARCWLGVTSPKLPSEVEALLDHRDFGPVERWTAEPEARLPFDRYPGEPRNADLLIHASDRHGDYLIAVEAKVDESFGSTVAETMKAAAKRKAANPRSNGVARVTDLIATLFGSEAADASSVGELRYQLLTATAGALETGKTTRVGRVIMLVQEFTTRLSAEAKQKRNGEALDRFVWRLSRGTVSKAEAGRLLGPFELVGSLGGPRLYIGKIVCDVRR
jgi:hypothetical protein